MRYKVTFKYHLTDLHGDVSEYKLGFSVEAYSISEAVEKARDEYEPITRANPFLDIKELEVVELS